MSGPLASVNLYRYSSKEYHANSGTVYYLYRFYDPNLQRWLNRDPELEEDEGNPCSYVVNSPLSWYDPFGLTEGSPSNMRKRRKIDEIARRNNGSDKWAKDKKKDNFLVGSDKCNKFVFDVTKEAGADMKVKRRAPLAGEMADPRTKIKNWRPLKPAEKAEGGDVAAYKIPGIHPGYSGHSGIITKDGNMSAHADTVHPVPGQFEDNQGTCYRRYTGD